MLIAIPSSVHIMFLIAVAVGVMQTSTTQTTGPAEMLSELIEKA